MRLVTTTKAQLAEVVNFCTNPEEFSVFAIDVTYDIGPFFVTTTTNRHLKLHDKDIDHQKKAASPGKSPKCSYSEFTDIAKTLLANTGETFTELLLETLLTTWHHHTGIWRFVRRRGINFPRQREFLKLPL